MIEGTDSSHAHHAGRVDERVAVVDIAPTVANWLGVAPPATSEGKPLPLPTK